MVDRSHYATESNVDVWIEGIKDSVTETVYNYALSESDAYIEREVGVQDKIATPQAVMDAAEFKAIELIYRQTNKKYDEKHPGIWFANEASKCIKAFVKGGAEESNPKQFSHSNSSNDWYNHRRRSGYVER
jgi:hypothetical protein